MEFSNSGSKVDRVGEVKAARDDHTIPEALLQRRSAWRRALAEWLREFPEEVVGKHVLEISVAAGHCQQLLALLFGAEMISHRLSK